jgi:hypothetical protein
MEWMDWRVAYALSAALSAVITYGLVLGIAHAWTALQTRSWAGGRKHAAISGAYAAAVVFSALILAGIWK